MKGDLGWGDVNLTEGNGSE